MHRELFPPPAPRRGVGKTSIRALGARDTELRAEIQVFSASESFFSRLASFLPSSLLFPSLASSLLNVKLSRRFEGAESTSLLVPIYSRAGE